MFWNCTAYNTREVAGVSNFGGPWGEFGQLTYYNTTLDDNASVGKSPFVLDAIGFHRFGAENGFGRLYEYGTKNASGTAVDLSKRVVNLPVSEGGYGMGTAIDEWQVLEFNPRNYFAASCGNWSSDWDPMNFAAELVKVDSALNSTNITVPQDDGTVVELPAPPAGIEYKWESISSNAIVSDDGKSLQIVRPAAGEANIESVVNLYAKDSANGYGDKKEIPVTITPTTNTDDVFTLEGTVTLSTPSKNAQSLTVIIKSGDAVVKTIDITVPAGQVSQAYKAELIPVGNYTASISISDKEYNLDEAEAVVNGAKGELKKLDISAKKMIEVEVTSDDFSEFEPKVNAAAGFSAEVYTSTGNESANLGSENTVYKLSKEEGKVVSASTGASINLMPLLKEGTSFANTKTLHFSFDFLMETTDYYPSNLSFFDLATSTSNAGKDSADDTRFVRWGVYKNWGQFNLFTSTNKRINGDNTQFAKNNNMANRWYTIAADIDLENKTITSTLYDRDKNMEILNKKPFTISSSGDGEYPTRIDLSNLYFNMYMDRNANTSNKMEYYFDNLVIKYQDFASDDIADTTPEPTTEPTQAPTPKVTEEPTQAPTEEPTKSPTTAPTEPMVVSAVKENGKTTVTTLNIKDGVVIAAAYNENGAVTAIKTAPAAENVVIDGIEADKIMIWNSLTDMSPLCAAYKVTVPATATQAPTQAPTTAPSDKPDFKALSVDFTAMSSVPVYSETAGQGFVEKSSAITAEAYRRQVAPTSKISVSSEGAKVTESDGAYLEFKKKGAGMDGDTYNHGGLIYRIDTGKPGAYHIEVEVTGSSADTWVAPTGMNASRLTGTGAWDTGGHVAHNVYASWSGSKWSYDFATGEDFIEIEIEPNGNPADIPTAANPKTVGIKNITITPLAVNEAGDKPTIHILGDSTQKTYTFNETISSWGQTLVNYFDPDKVNVINYSMGGRAMRSNYSEGRFDEILINGKAGDYVFIHSAHNDETVSTDRFGRGAAVDGSGTEAALAANNANQQRWIDMYISAIKARGMTPVLVTAMPRTGNGRYNETNIKPNGFNPDSPGNMRIKAAADSEVGLAELYAGAKEYIDSLDAKEIFYIYNNFEAGETPANNSANGTNGDGTHYREAASKMWSRIILQSIYDQSVAADDKYTDKNIMKSLVELMPAEVVEAAQSGDWSRVFPEMASDVSAVGIVPGAQKQEESNYYYRNNIEKALQVGLMHKDTSNMFMPNEIITVGEFARGMEKAFGLEENSLTSYTKTYAELNGKAGLFNSDYAELADGEYAVTVDSAEGGEITVYNESAFHTSSADITAAVEANAVIADNEYFTFTAPSEIVKKADKNGDGVWQGITGAAVEVRNNGTKQARYTAKADGILTLYLMFVDHKLITCENKTTGEKSTKYINDTTVAGTTQENQYSGVTFNVKAGNDYEVYTNGGTGRLFGIKYESNDYPQSTTALQANLGDTIRVTARPNENYVNGKIIINGVDVTDSKEYIFTLEGNTTVSASFIKEPSLVDTTVVASDAALTREVMGAVLYDAYIAKYGKDENGNWNKVQYMKQNGGVPSPDDPSYDPNIKYEGSPYIPLTGWGKLEDVNELDSVLYRKVKEAYNLGLMRSEKDIARGSINNGTVFEPKAKLTRAKAAKTLVFNWMLTQNPSDGNHTINGGNGISEAALNKAAVNAAEIKLPNPDAPSAVIQ